MKRYIYILALAVLSLAACNKEQDFAPVALPGGEEFIITATRDGAASRTVLQKDKSVWWSAAEKIDVFFDGHSAEFTGQNTEPAATATFKGALDVVPDGTKDIYAVYPSSEVNDVDADGNITLEVPATQTAVAGTFADKAFPAVAVSKTSTMAFQNVAGGIKFKVAEPGVTDVVIEANGAEAIAGVVSVAFDEGIPEVKGTYTPSSTVTILAPAGGFVPDVYYYAALLPTELGSGITISLGYGTPSRTQIVSEKAQTVKRGIFGNVGELVGVKVERVWGKYSTSEASWNEYFGGAAGTDRNVAMDDDYIYLAETNKSKKLWALNVADGSFAKLLPTTTVQDKGTFYLSCPRVINLGGTPTLVVCNMTEDINQVPLYLYVYENGIEAEPTAISFSAWNGGRMGDTFSFWGASATNSADGLGLSKGLLYFDTMFQGDGVRIFKTVWTKGSLPTAQEVKVRYAFDNGNTCVGAFWPYPGNKDAGIWGARAYDVKSVFGGVADGAPNMWTDSTPGNQTENTVTEEIASGWYKSVPCYQYFTYGGHRFIAYTRQIDGADGRLIILRGASDEDWKDILDAHRVVYQAAIQNDRENKSEYEASPRSSGNNAMDLCIRVKEDGVYLACVKQNVGLSLFRMTLR